MYTEKKLKEFHDHLQKKVKNAPFVIVIVDDRNQPNYVSNIKDRKTIAAVLKMLSSTMKID